MERGNEIDKWFCLRLVGQMVSRNVLNATQPFYLLFFHFFEIICKSLVHINHSIQRVKR